MGLQILALPSGRVPSVRDASVTYQRNWDKQRPLPMIMFVITGGDRPIMVDTGTPDAAFVREYFGYTFERPESEEPLRQLNAAGIDPADVRNVVFTHLHWDHCSNVDLFPNARFTVQDEELKYAVSPIPLHRRAYQHLPGTAPPWLPVLDRLNVISGTVEIVPGVSTVPERSEVSPTHPQPGVTDVSPQPGVSHMPQPGVTAPQSQPQNKAARQNPAAEPQQPGNTKNPDSRVAATPRATSKDPLRDRIAQLHEAADLIDSALQHPLSAQKVLALAITQALVPGLLPSSPESLHERATVESAAGQNILDQFANLMTAEQQNLPAHWTVRPAAAGRWAGRGR